MSQSPSTVLWHFFYKMFHPNNDIKTSWCQLAKALPDHKLVFSGACLFEGGVHVLRFVLCIPCTYTYDTHLLIWTTSHTWNHTFLRIQGSTRTCTLNETYIGSVHELMGWVHNVVLIKCIFGSGKPKGGRDFGWEGTWARWGYRGVSLLATWERGGRILSQKEGSKLVEKGSKGSKGEQRKYAMYNPCFVVYIMECLEWLKDTSCIYVRGGIKIKLEFCHIG